MDQVLQQKKGLVKGVFNKVFKKYDLMNDLMSLGIHRIWKKNLIQMMNPSNKKRLIDVACGTGDVAKLYLEATDNISTILCVDPNINMIKECKKNLKKYKNIKWKVCSAERLNVPDNSFDFYTISFGLRNAKNINKSLKEAHRVLKSGGRFLCLEFSKIENNNLEILYKNYSKLIENSEFWIVTARSLLVVSLTLPLELLISLGLALLLTEAFPGRAMVRTLILLPWMLPPIVNGFLWGWLLNGEYGALNGLLYQMGIIDEYVTWLRNPDTQIIWVAVVQTWTRFAFPTIILLAGLQSIPKDLLDAAKVDGASSWQSFKNIVLPLLMPSFAVALTIEFIAAFQIFDVIWTLTAGGSAGGAINPFTKTLMLYNYELVFRDLRIGLGAALSYLILFLSLGVAIVFVTRLYNQAVKS